MKELKVALVSFYFGEYCVRLAGGIAQDPKVHLYLFLPRTQSDPYLHLLSPSVELHSFDTPRIRQTYSHIQMLMRLVGEIKALEPDVIHFQHGHLTFNLLALPLLAKYPLVLTIHDASIHIGDGESRRTPQWVHDRATRQARNRIVHAPQVKEALVGRLGIAHDSVHVVPHVVIGEDASATTEEPPDGEPLILFFGRIWEYKGLEYLIRAQPLIAAKVPQARIVIAGEGEDFDRYNRMMQDPDRFVVHNEYVSDEMRAELFRKASVVVLPYVEASQSGVIPIAYSFQKPVVATNVGGLPELVDHGQTGYLVPPRDSQALADALVRLLRDKNLRRRLGLNGARKINSECSPEIVGKQTRQVYRQAIPEARAAMGTPSHPIGSSALDSSIASRQAFQHGHRRQGTPERGSLNLDSMKNPPSISNADDATAIPVRPLRVLHVLGDLTRGGIETWLMHVLRRTDRSRFQMDFFLRSMKTGGYEQEAESLGSNIGRSDRFLNPWQFEKDLRDFVRQHGPYDIVHSHFAEFNGLVLWIAARCGIPIRIAHSHNDTRLIDNKARLHRRAYLSLGKRLIRSYATHCFAADDGPAASQFGKSWKLDPRVRIVRCGIDLAPFARGNGAGRLQLRRELGFPYGAFIVGHVGRFAAQKNHAFLLRILASLAQTDPNVYLLLVGAGPMLEDVQSLIVASGLASRVVRLEPRSDVPRLMLDAMDVFVLPSLHEGLPLVSLEAQAAGLPCVVSEATPSNASVVPGGIEFLSLQLSAEAWAERIARYKSIARTMPGVSPLTGTPFDIEVSASRLFEFYAEAQRESMARGRRGDADNWQTQKLRRLSGSAQHQ